MVAQCARLYHYFYSSSFPWWRQHIQQQHSGRELNLFTLFANWHIHLAHGWVYSLDAITSDADTRLIYAALYCTLLSSKMKKRTKNCEEETFAQCLKLYQKSLIFTPKMPKNSFLRFCGRFLAQKFKLGIMAKWDFFKVFSNTVH